MVEAHKPTDQSLNKLLENHPGVSLIESSSSEGLTFIENGHVRRILVGDANLETSGLIELMDNNPVVCAESVGIPGPVATLAMIALGPLVRASLLREEPVMQVSVPLEENVEGFLSGFGWQGGIQISGGDEDLGSVIAANVMALITTPDDWSEIDDLYDECYGGSFYVRKVEDAEWDTKSVSGKPYAHFGLRVTPGEETSLLTAQVMADKDGKCGAAQVVHAMNVMCGYEECAGLDY